MTKSNYSEDSIKVLKGLEPVKERPGMYTRTDSPTHICQEVIDNAADEALGGFATQIDVAIHADGSLSVRDNGRGIPTGLHPIEQIPVVELVFTQLHAGGKFNKKSGNGAYAFSGGLHGVGVSVTNALSTRLEVTVKREGKISRIVFSGGDVVEPLAQIGKCAAKDTGTEVRVYPDAKYFENPNYSIGELERLLRAKAVLLQGVTVTLTREIKGLPEKQTWHYPQGLRSYLADLLENAQEAVPIFATENYISGSHDDFQAGEGAAFALTWLEDGSCANESYVNLIPTPLGGTHEAGLKQAAFNAVNNFIAHHNLLPRGVKLQSDDVFSRVAFVLSARVLDPQFQGQTKDKLTNRDALKLVAAVSGDPLELWLNENVEFGKKIAELAIRQAQARMRSVKKIEKKKGSGVAVLPGKLTDCESEDVRENELFLVEGDSAGGSAKLARDKSFQAVLPLRGKVLNSFEVHRDQLFGNAEIHDISVAIGIDPHGKDDDVDLSGLRYGKIAILSDADVDGSHIQVLLLTLFYRHFPKLVELGHIYVAQPPLFRVDVNAQGKNKPARKLYALDQAELDGILERLNAEKVRETAYSISRFKGLGEMNPDQLKDTTLHPDTRRLLQVRIPDEMEVATESVFLKLMGKGEASSRRAWMEVEGDKVEGDI
ncbi:DNA topoisomerase IV subunit B [Kingella negevensis]|uniref:DNA topoisomerase IV subunit B n=1 Tax=Kingella negevensis TaxID=1522312 RepID=UPI00254B37A6|nr:DNA topoisomerase IV subunit B [Kingella negevensis]MDK4681144.1 DNA topoisomerase IV subunit B [Kingella negevensis]MDK4683346.1 DNA topoisomerase IV subunit B [Kingella negevensis]MDK4691523.1 DNA topoisomerase IV subunit B [Kingella negevensis]MDK4693326.1 DNA topoisomerase IV subunit B [Kingella negevensis]MDK4699626.1 DNA topoisomerase IV subunit B [Kingella negevensis]